MMYQSMDDGNAGYDGYAGGPPNGFAPYGS